MKKISVLLVDDHALFREGLESLLHVCPTIEVVGTAADGAQALQLARELMPDLVLMDVRMPGIGGLEATRQLKSEMPETCVVMLTMSEDDQDLFEAIKSGARGYLLKSTSLNELCYFIEGAIAGEAPISGVMATKMLSEFQSPTGDSSGEQIAAEKLTDRESDVLGRVAEGLTNREIAAALAISESTVKKHLRNVLAKLHLQNRVQAALYAAHSPAHPMP